MLFSTLILFSAHGHAQALKIKNLVVIADSEPVLNCLKSPDCDSRATAEIVGSQGGKNDAESSDSNDAQKVEKAGQKADSAPLNSTALETYSAETAGKKKKKPAFSDAKDSSPNKEKFHWKAALIESGIFLGIQHGFRLSQPKTTGEFGGPFFRDWGNSIKNLRGWNDGDSPFTNNFAHPLQGGATGRIFVNNSDRAKKQEFGKSKEYWNSRFKALIWSAAWSTQFEFGPVSEASIGNVGLRQKNGHSTAAWTDLVMTPVVGTAVLIEEDMIDRYILKNWLEKKSNYRVTTKIKFLRSVLTPTTSFSNLLRGKLPWKRDSR